jgi:hypothetical protein
MPLINEFIDSRVDNRHGRTPVERPRTVLGFHELAGDLAWTHRSIGRPTRHHLQNDKTGAPFTVCHCNPGHPQEGIAATVSAA